MENAAAQGAQVECTRGAQLEARRGAQVLLEALVAQGVDTVFGYPGGAILSLYDALYQFKGRLRHILTAHEQGAAHAADGYARASGKPGVAIATSGPGATNLITGIATAYMDSVPLVAITGNVASHLLGKDSFQEVDITGMTMAVTKHNFIVQRVTEIESTVARAFQIATEGRPGPVLIDIPKDVLEALCPAKGISGLDTTVALDTTGAHQQVQGLQDRPWKRRRAYSDLSEAALAPLVERLQRAKRPMILAGGGVVRAEASEALKALAAHMDAPVAMSLMGLGALPAASPYALGMVGMHGTARANRAIGHCDLLIAIGARFSDRVIGKVSAFAEQADIVHIDVDPAEIDKSIRCDYSIIHELSSALSAIMVACPPQERPLWQREIATFEHEADSGPDSRERQILRALKRQADEACVIVTDVGQHQMWTAQYFPFDRPRQLITSGGLGTMGFGLGAANGAQMAYPRRQTILVTGDGSFQMNCIELVTAVRYSLPVKVILFDNGVLGMVRQWQHLFFEDRLSETVTQRRTDFGKLAEAYGAKAFRIGATDNPDVVLKEALSTEGPVVVTCEIPKEALVMPMVPPGAGLGEMLIQKGGKAYGTH